MSSGDKDLVKFHELVKNLIGVHFNNIKKDIEVALASGNYSNILVKNVDCNVDGFNFTLKVDVDTTTNRLEGLE